MKKIYLLAPRLTTSLTIHLMIFSLPTWKLWQKLLGISKQCWKQENTNSRSIQIIMEVYSKYKKFQMSRDNSWEPANKNKLTKLSLTQWAPGNYYYSVCHYYTNVIFKMFTSCNKLDINIYILCKDKIKIRFFAPTKHGPVSYTHLTLPTICSV